MQSKISTTPHDTTGPMARGEGGNITLMHDPKLVKKENSGESLESEKEHLQAEDCEECLQINYYIDNFKSEDSKYDSSPQDDKEGIQLVSSCILPCSDIAYDQQTADTKDKVSKQSAMSGPELCNGTTGDNKVSFTTPHDTAVHKTRGDGGNIALMHNPKLVKKENMRESLESEKEHLQAKDCEECLQINNYIDKFKSEKEPVLSITPPPVVIKPEPLDVISQKNYEKNYPQKKIEGTNIQTSGSRNSKLQKCEMPLVNMENCVSIQQQKNTFKCTVCGLCFTHLDHLKRHKTMHSEKGLFTCTVCAKVFSSKLELTIHLPSHSPHECSVGETPLVNEENCVSIQLYQPQSDTFKCSECGLCFTHSDHLKRHKKIHRGEGPYTCTVCAQEFTSKLELTTHLPSHSPHECTVCGKRYSLLRNLSVHMRLHKGEKSSETSSIQKRFARSSSLKSHQLSHLEEKPFNCDVWGNGFIRRSELISHQLLHTGERPYKCTVCGKEFYGNTTLTRHILSHSEENIFKCDVCGKEFNQKINLNTHRWTHETTYTCKVCGRRFATLSSLDRHQLSHREKVPGPCTVCGRRFITASSLAAHQLTHREKVPGPCTVRGRRFITASSLTEHQQTHRQHGPFSCAVCSKEFTSNLELSTHLPSHSPHEYTVSETPLVNKENCVFIQSDQPQSDTFKCSECGLCFTHSDHLERHKKIHRGMGPYTCTLCAKEFASKLELTTHLPTHSPHECIVCGKRFSHLKIFTLHMRMHDRETSSETSSILTEHHGEHGVVKPYTCKDCGKMFCRSSYLKAHQYTHSAEKRFKCDTCGKGFNRRTNLTSHQRIHTGEKPHRCTVCCKGFADSSNLTRHKLSHSAEKPFKCDMCGKEFKLKTNLTNHRCTHERTYSCEVGARRFATSSSLTAHQVTHTRDVLFTCTACSKVFSSKLELNTHLPSHTPHECTVSETPLVNKENGVSIQSDLPHSDTFKCSECGLCFTHSDHLKRHKKIHRGMGPYTCTVCAKVFTSKFELTTHLSTHSPHKCTICGKRYSRLRNLSLHMRLHKGEKSSETSSTVSKQQQTHRGEKPYACTVCNMGFGRSSSLKSHQLSHSEKMPFKCDVCEKGFIRRNDLTIHQRTHTGERPYKCTLCGKGFSTPGALTSHQRTHWSSAEKPFKCDVCGKDFNQKTNLTNHRFRHETTDSCDVCGRCFASPSCLDKHHLIHTEQESL